MTDTNRIRRPVNRFGRGKSHRNLALIEAARAILAEIKPASIRAICYRLFTMKLITSMAKGETNRVSEQLTWAREHGVIPWSWIVDETRAPERVNAFTDPQDYVEVVKRSYRKDRWTNQPEWIEVWSEKGTVRGTLASVLDAYGITLRVLHGYGSTTAVYEAAQDSVAGDDKLLTVLYVGDHDPSGLHMSEVDLPRRLKEYGGVIDFVRLALTDEDSEATENEVDVEGLLAFAEHLLTNAARLWIELGLEQKQRLQHVLFPKGLQFDGEKFGTAVTCLAFKQLEESRESKSELASPTGTSQDVRLVRGRLRRAA